MKDINAVRRVLIKDPLENVFEIEEQTTFAITEGEEDDQASHLPVTTQQATDPVISEHYDGKDVEVESQFQVVYTKALEGYEIQSQELEFVEGKYKARIGEVAAQFLNTALAAAREKRALKEHKDKLNIEAMKATGPKTVNQNLIVADRNEILKVLMGQKDETD